MNAPEIPPVLNQSQIIKFSITRSDLILCRLRVLVYRKIIVVFALLFSFGIPCLDLPQVADKPIGFKIFYFFVMAAIWLFIFIFFQVVTMCLFTFFSPNRGILGAHELEIRNDGLWVKTEVNEAIYRWSGFDKTRSALNFFFVFVTDNIVIYVPQRCFQSDGQAKQFKDEIARRTGKS